ncbi:MAG: hypothetical protein IBV52_09470 [Candidatus Bathyarchaeota archaeon]
MERSTRSILALLERRWNGLWNGDRTDIKLIFNLKSLPLTDSPVAMKKDDSFWGEGTALGEATMSTIVSYLSTKFKHTTGSIVLRYSQSTAESLCASPMA